LEDGKQNKVERVLHIYSKLMRGEIVIRRELSNHFNVNDRTIQRDRDDIRNYACTQLNEMVSY